MTKKRQQPVDTAALIAELREIEADWKAKGEAERAAFREAWAAKMAGRPWSLPMRIVVGPWLGYQEPPMR